MRDETEHRGDSEALGLGARRCRDAEGVTLEIRPEPTPEEREAILRALAELDGEAEPAEWWAAGVRDAFEPDGADPFGVSP